MSAVTARSVERVGLTVMREGPRPATRRARAAWSVLAVLCLGLVLATLRSPCGQRSDEDERLVIQRELEARGVAFTRARYMARTTVGEV